MHIKIIFSVTTQLSILFIRKFLHSKRELQYIVAFDANSPSNMSLPCSCDVWLQFITQPRALGIQSQIQRELREREHLPFDQGRLELFKYVSTFTASVRSLGSYTHIQKILGIYPKIQDELGELWYSLFNTGKLGLFKYVSTFTVRSLGSHTYPGYTLENP